MRRPEWIDFHPDPRVSRPPRTTQWWLASASLTTCIGLMFAVAAWAAGRDAGLVGGLWGLTALGAVLMLAGVRAYERDRRAERGTTIRTADTLKSVREALCLAQSALGQWPVRDRPGDRSATLGRLIADIDRQRPLGSDGTHGGRHTATCGCVDTEVS